jgi:hypothetical protein
MTKPEPGKVRPSDLRRARHDETASSARRIVEGEANARAAKSARLRAARLSQEKTPPAEAAVKPRLP